jgi:Fic family protein
LDVDDQKYLKLWLKALGRDKPEKLWRELVSSDELPGIDYSNAISAVYSSNIEGNQIDVNSYLASKFRGRRIQFKAKERKEIENLESAYRFAQSHALNEKNFLTAHSMLAATFLPKITLGKYRDQMVYVYSRAGMEYAALEAEHVPGAMRKLFAQIRKLRKSSMDVSSAFYHAALIHLVFAHIHPFMDGNGRTARLLEKWFLASRLGPEAWHVPSEMYYKEHVAEYYQNIKLGLNFYTLDYDRCVPFLTMLVKSLDLRTSSASGATLSNLLPIGRGLG